MIKWIISTTLVVFLLPEILFAKNTAAHLAPLDIHWDTQRSLPAMVRMSGDQIEWDSNDAIRKSYQFLNVYKDLYGITEAETDLRLIDTKEDNLGMSHVTLQQVIAGIPVYGSYLKTHFRNDGSLSL